MHLCCPRCEHPLAAPSNATIICPCCNGAWYERDLVESASLDGVLSPPKGCWLIDQDDLWRAGFTTRRFEGVVSATLWVTALTLGIAVPVYRTSLIVFLGVLPVLSLFYGVGALVAAFSIAGRIEIGIDREGGYVFEGVGRIGRRTRFNPDTLRGAYQESSGNSRSPIETLLLIGERNLLLRTRNKNDLSFLRAVLTRRILQPNWLVDPQMMNSVPIQR